MILFVPTNSRAHRTFSLCIIVINNNMSRSVHFSSNLVTSVHYFPRVDASCIQDLYYQDEDYRRFREERWLESMRQRQSSQAAESLRSSREAMEAIRDLNKRSREQRRQGRGSLKFIKGRKNVSQQQGVAMAA